MSAILDGWVTTVLLIAVAMGTAHATCRALVHVIAVNVSNCSILLIEFALTIV